MSALQNLLEDLAVILGAKIHGARSISGGDINETFGLQTSTGKYFLKIDDANRYPAMLEKEARGLASLQSHCSLTIPGVVAVGTTAGFQFLVLTFIEKCAGNDTAWAAFGESLAAMHKVSFESFGWEESNYIGSIAQPNDYRNDWAEFYSSQRIMPLVLSLFEKGKFSNADVSLAESFCSRLGLIFPKEPPSLVHGDLWNGNCMIVEKGGGNMPGFAIYDPAIYFGHREMDIAMTKFFGGFSSRFYESYLDVFPLEPGWQSRMQAAQLYPLLVHAALFGGGYISQSVNIMRAYTR